VDDVPASVPRPQPRPTYKDGEKSIAETDNVDPPAGSTEDAVTALLSLNGNAIPEAPDSNMDATAQSLCGSDNEDTVGKKRKRDCEEDPEESMTLLIQLPPARSD